MHHRELHRSRDERAWWRRLGLDSIKIAEMFWKKTRLAGSHTVTETGIAVGHAQTGGSQVAPPAAKAVPVDESTAESEA